MGKALLSANRAGDQLVVTKLDRLGRSLEHLIELSNTLQARGVDPVVLDQGIDTSTPVGRMFFQILGSIAVSILLTAANTRLMLSSVTSLSPSQV